MVAGILLSLPEEALTSAEGLTGAFTYVSGTVMGDGAAGHAIGYIFGIILIITLVSSGSVWILGSSRVQAVAALDGAAPRWLGKFGKQGTPTSMAWLSGIIGSISVIGVFWVSSGGGDTLNNAMAVFLGIALSTAVLCYIFTVPSIIALRKKYPDTPRPFVVPGGKVGLWVCVILAEACIILTGFTLLWPGLIDNLLGQEYSILDNWGVSRAILRVHDARHLHRHPAARRRLLGGRACAEQGRRRQRRGHDRGGARGGLSGLTGLSDFKRRRALAAAPAAALLWPARPGARLRPARRAGALRSARLYTRLTLGRSAPDHGA